MKLIKIRDGLLEAENFFIASSFSDYFNPGATRVVDDDFHIVKNINIERNMAYESYVVEIKKENHDVLNDEDMYDFYIGDTIHKYGLRDGYYQENESEYWKIIFYDKWIQTYMSPNGKSWAELGGERMVNYPKIQGFRKHGDQDLILKDYKVYADPYLTLINFPEGYLAELHKINDFGQKAKIKERYFDEAGRAQIFIDTPDNYFIIVKNELGEIVIDTAELYIKYGDQYYCSNYNIELMYDGKVLEETPTRLHSYKERIVVWNNSSETYTDLKVSIDKPWDNSDVIELSHEMDKGFCDEITIGTLAPNERKDIFVGITKGYSEMKVNVRNFILKII